MSRPRGFSDRMRIPLLVAGAWTVLGLLNASRLRVLLPHYEPDFGWSQALLWGLPDALFWAVLSAVPILLARRFPLGRDPRVWAVHALGAAVVVVVHGAIDAFVNRFGFGYSGLDLLTATINRVSESFYANLLVYALVVGITQYLVSVGELREARRRSAELDAQLAEARLQALRMQIRPHFIMNALNTVAGLVELDPEAARTNLRRLGDLMRASLSADKVDLVPLSNELAFTRDYLEIERSRFQDRLQTHFEVEPGSDNCLVPVFLLQPLAENAVVHGIAPKPEGGRVEIHVLANNGMLRFEVKDDGVGFVEDSRRDVESGLGTGSEGMGIGLQNVRSRLESLYGENQEFEIEPSSPTGTRVRVSIPRREFVAKSRRGDELGDGG